MITFGLTGGIACGKSTATKTFIAENIPMVDADVVARQVVEPNKYGLSLIVQAFGSKHLNEDGTLNRATLAKLVFSDKEAMDKLNHIMGPLIQEESMFQLRKLHSEGHRIVGYDAALIVEMGNADKFRPLIVVHCPVEMQIARMVKRNSVSIEDAKARIAHQLPMEEKIKLADYLIDTSGPVENSITATKKIIHALRVKDLRQRLDSGEITYNQVPWPYRDTAGNDISDE